MKKLLILLVLAGGGFYLYTHRPAASSSYINPSAFSAAPVANEKKALQGPVQKDLRGSKTIRYGKGAMSFLAEYEITARILSKKNYTLDENARISPTDLALGWGMMSVPKVYSQLSISQSGRWYHYRWRNAPPIAPDDIATHSANVHIVPANDQVKKRIDSLREDQLATLKGYLIYYKETEKNAWWEWRSSLTRTDSGGGSCEVFYVEHVIGY